MIDNLIEANKRIEWYEKKYGPYIEGKRGLHNWKNLFRWPTFQEWIILILTLMAIFMGWAYQHDTQVCRQFVNTQQIGQANSQAYLNNVTLGNGSDIIPWGTNPALINRGINASGQG